MEIDYLNIILKCIPSNAEILDLGCGTGEPIAKFFIEKGYHITGVDAAVGMIDLCIQRFPNEKWILEDMRRLNLKDRFDLIIAWDSFFHLNHDDQRKMFRIFDSHIKSKGLLVLTTGPEYSEVYSNMSGYEFYHASLDTSEYEKLLAEHNFKVLVHKIEDPKCGDHTVWIAQSN